jgi:hypothetical protein
MKPRSILQRTCLALVAFGTSSFHAQSDQGTKPMDHSEIQKTIDTNNAAVAALDIEAILATYEPNAVMATEPGKSATGTEALRSLSILSRSQTEDRRDKQRSHSGWRSRAAFLHVEYDRQSPRRLTRRAVRPVSKRAAQTGRRPLADGHRQPVWRPPHQDTVNSIARSVGK